MQIRKLFLLLFFNIIVIVSYSQRYYKYDNYCVNNGLSNNYVERIFQDSYGYMWIGTWDGINRFDGYNFNQYNPIRNKKNSIIGNWVFCIFEDKDKNLWVGTNGGLSRYNRSYDNFENITAFNFTVSDIKQDKKGLLWISSPNGLFQYDSNKDTVVAHLHQTYTTKEFPSNEINEIQIDIYNNIWIASGNSGLIHYNIKTGKSRVYKVSINSGQSIVSNKLHTLTFDKDGKLWIGSYDNGVSVMDTATKQFTSKVFDKNKINSIGGNCVSQIVCDTKNTIWICCQNGFLNRYNRSTDDFYRFEYNPYINTSLQSESISCILPDNLGNLWIGSHGNGFFFYNKLKNNFHSYQYYPSREKSLTHNKVSSFVEMDDKKIIIGTDGRGLNIFDPKNETFENVPANSVLRSMSIMEIKRGEGQIIWISTWNGGIAKFNYKTGEITNYVNDPNDENSLIFNNIKGIYPDRNYLWIATHGEGVARYDINKDKFSSYKNNDNPFGFREPVWANSIFIDSKKRIWISSYSKLHMFDGNKLRAYSSDPNNNNAIMSNSVLSVFEDSNKKIWILTTYGIDVYNEKEDNFEHYSLLYNLPKNPKAIIEDNNKNIWISSSSGLVCFNPVSKEMKQYSINDGLLSNDYIFKAACKLKDGSLIFGGTSGITMFYPDSIESSTNKPKIFFTNLYIDHKLQSYEDSLSPLKKSLQCTDTLILDYSNSSLGINFTGIDFSNPENLIYSYMLKGFNNDWINLGKEKDVSFTGLPAGNYTLRIKVTSKDNESIVNETQLTIIILPPWWSTWWFAIIVISFIVLSIILTFKIRMRRIKKQNKLLELLVKKRTTDLEKANSDLSQLNVMKDKLFSIIAHDLKNPIGVILGYSELLTLHFENYTKQKIFDFSQRIYNSTSTIYNQLDELFNWAIVQSKSMNHNPKETDLTIIINNTIKLVNEMAQRKNIHINISQNTKQSAFVDHDMIATVVRNLVTNAIKFTPTGGKIEIELHEIDNKIALSIADSGIGIPQEKLNTLFSSQHISSTPGTEQEQGSGLGLNICKEFVEKNGGTLRVSSVEGEGSCFTCCFPRVNSN